MDNTIFADLVWKGQMGDADAVEQLLLAAYTPVNFLAAKLLQDPDTAHRVARESLETVAAKLDTLTEPDEYEKWVCKMTAARCVQAMPLYNQNDTVPDNHWKDALTDGQTLTEEESAQAVLNMLDALPERQRLCILLLCCGKLSVSAIAQLTGFSNDTVKESITRGQTGIQEQLWELQSRDIQLTGLSSLDGILHRAMHRKPEGEDPIPLIYGILGKEIPIPPDPEKTLIRILTVVLVILVIAVLIAAGILVMMLLDKPAFLFAAPGALTRMAGVLLPAGYML